MGKFFFRDETSSIRIKLKKLLLELVKLPAYHLSDRVLQEVLSSIQPIAAFVKVIVAFARRCQFCVWKGSCFLVIQKMSDELVPVKCVLRVEPKLGPQLSALLTGDRRLNVNLQKELVERFGSKPT